MTIVAIHNNSNRARLLENRKVNDAATHRTTKNNWTYRKTHKKKQFKDKYAPEAIYNS